MSNTEAKLAKSLDDIIAENATKFKKGGAKGPKSDGPRKKGVAVGARKGLQSHQAPKQQHQGGGGGGKGGRAAVQGLGVNRGSGIIKKMKQGGGGGGGGGGFRPAPQQQFYDDGDYGMGGGYGGGGGGGRGGRGRGGFRGRQQMPPGNVDGAWEHDLYDEREHAPPPRRMVHQPAPMARPGPGPARAAPNASGGCTLIVRGLADEVNDQDLAELFSTCGKVVRAAVVWDNSGRSTGEGEVVMGSRAEADAAVQEYNGVLLDNKKLTIEIGQAVAVQKLSSGRSVVRPLGGGPAPGRGGGMAGRLIRDGMGGGPGPMRGGPRGGRGGGMGGGRLRSGVVSRSKADLDADMDNFMQE